MIEKGQSSKFQDSKRGEQSKSQPKNNKKSKNVNASIAKRKDTTSLNARFSKTRRRKRSKALIRAKIWLLLSLKPTW